MAKRFEALDSWRGICACMVALFHLSPEFNWSLRGHPLIAHAGVLVDFFFVLSGFVIAGAYRARLECGESIVAFMLRRFGRIYPLHLATLCAAILLAVTAVLLPLSQFNPRAVFDGDLRDFTAIFTNLFLLQGIGFENHFTWNFPSWSISTEFYTYLVFAILWSITGRRGFPVAIGVVVICQILPFMLPGGTLSVLTLINCISCFAIGALIQMAYSWLAPRLTFMHDTLTATAIECAVVAGGVAFVMAGAPMFAAPLFGLVVLVFAFEGGWLSRALRTRPALGVGALSYSIYMNHIVVAFAATQVLLALQGAAGIELRTLGTATGNRLWGSTVLEGDIGLALVTALILAISALTYHFIETPGRLWGVRMAKGWNNRAAATRQEAATSSPEV